MRTVTHVADTRSHAERLAMGYGCPAVNAFIDDFEVAGSCRFIGTDADQEEVSVLIIAAIRPLKFARDTSDA